MVTIEDHHQLCKVRVNRSDAGAYRLNFKECDNTLYPELTPAILQRLGVKVTVIPRLKAPEGSTVTMKYQ